MFDKINDMDLKNTAPGSYTIGVYFSATSGLVLPLSKMYKVPIRPTEIVTSLFDNTSSTNSGHFSEIKKKILTSWTSPSEVGIATITFT